MNMTVNSMVVVGGDVDINANLKVRPITLWQLQTVALVTVEDVLPWLFTEACTYTKHYNRQQWIWQGIQTHIYISQSNKDITIYLQILIDNCTILNNHHTADDMTIGYVLLKYLESLGTPVILRNVSCENKHWLSSYSGIDLFLARRIDCRSFGSKGTPINATNSTFKVSGTFTSVNNTGYWGGAMAFNGGSYMSVSLEKEHSKHFYEQLCVCTLLKNGVLQNTLGALCSPGY